jgi:hypothetical protein
VHGLDGVFSSQKKKERQCSLLGSWDGMERDVIRVVPEPVPIAGREEHRYAIEYAPEGAEDLRYTCALVIYIYICMYVYIFAARGDKEKKKKKKKEAAGLVPGRRGRSRAS